MLSEARTPSYQGTETLPWGSVDKSFGSYADAWARGTGRGTGKPPATIADANAACRAWIASKTLLGDAKADTAEDLIFFPVVNPNTNKLNAGALRAVMGGRGSQASIGSGAKASAKAKATALYKRHFQTNKELVMLSNHPVAGGRWKDRSGVLPTDVVWVKNPA